MRHPVLPPGGWNARKREAGAIVLLLALLAPAEVSVAVRGHSDPGGGAGPRGASTVVAEATDPGLDRLELDGEYARAIVRAESLHAAARRARDGRRETAFLERLARLHVAQGTHAEALPMLEEVVRRRREDRDVFPVLLAEALVGLGTARKNAGRYDDAMACHREALGLAQRTGETGRAQAARALAGMANVVRVREAERGRAMRWLAEAVRIGEAALDVRGEELASLRTNLALVQLQLGQERPAREQLDLAIAVRRRVLGPAHPSLGFSLALLGQALLMEGRFVEAEAALREASRINIVARARAAPGTNRMRYRPKVFAAWAASLVSLGRGEEAWQVLDDGLSLFSQERIEQLGGGLSRGSDEEAMARAQARRKVRAGLSPGVAVVGWLDANLVNELPWRSWAYVIRAGQPVHWIPLEVPDESRSYAGISDARNRLLTRLRAASEWPLRVPESARLRQDARAVWRERFAALEPFLKGVQRLLVVASEGFPAGPLEIWEDEGGRPLIERFAVSYLPSFSLLAGLESLPRPKGIGEVWIVEADYDPEDTVESRERAGGAASGLAELRGAASEAQRVARLFPGARRIVGEEALRTRCREAAGSPAGARIGLLHVSGHAVADAAFPGFNALVLGRRSRDEAQAARTGIRDGRWSAPASDGILTAAEIESLPIEADLVNLSACRTYGRHDFGGFEGIAEAFLHGRARSVLVSLWPVDDRATAQLMAAFHEEYAEALRRGASRPKAQALRRSKLRLTEFRDAEGRRPYLHPSYWAGFVLLGDPGEWEDPGALVAATSSRTGAPPSSP